MCTLPGNMALQRCLGLLQFSFRIVSKELNVCIDIDDLVDCIEVLTVNNEYYRLLKSVNLNTEGLAVDR